MGGTSGGSGGNTGGFSGSGGGVGGLGGSAGTGGEGGTGGSACGSTATDPSNCGACGHSCFGGTCSNGACQPFKLSSQNEYEVDGIAVTSKAVFWGSYSVNHLMKCDLPGCASGPKELAKGSGPVIGVAVDATSVYFTDWGVATGAVRKCLLPDCSGGPIDMVVGLDKPNALSVSNTAIFWNSFSGGVVATCSLGCAASSGIPLASSQKTSVALALTSQSVVWSVMGSTPGTGAIRSCALPSCAGGPASLAEGLNSPGDVVVIGNDVVWQSGTSAIMRCGLPSCSGGPTVVRDGLTDLHHIATDGTKLYYLASGPHVCDMPSCATPKKVADGSAANGTLATNGAVLAWAHLGNVWAIALPP